MAQSIIDEERTGAARLSAAELQRYSRHLIMPEVTAEGQKRLKAARILCIGAGGLGSPAALYLAAAGVGRLGIVDFDKVDLTNLQRQILHGTKDVGRSKLESARDRLRDINPEIEIKLHECRFSSESAGQIVADYDVVVDGSDNFATRYLSNDICVFAGKPNVYGSVFRFEGQTTVFAPHLGGPCYRCLFPEPPPPESVPNCAQAGVLGVLPGIIGMLQAIETIKLIVGIGDPLIGRLIHVDALKVHFRELKLRRDSQCPVCGENPTIFAPIDYDQFCGAREDGSVPAISVQELKRKMDASEAFELIDVREPFEFEIARIDRAKLIPLGEIPERADELQREQPIVVHCHSGRRSAQAVRLLKQRGFANVYNLEGGIDAWSDFIDPTVPKY
jgi:molybdopterin/thiamine biosynthesis adenylyltransferase/rhodanese-related sulfurtransferase